MEELILLAALTPLLVLLLKPARSFLVKCWKKLFGGWRDQLDRIESELVTNGGTSMKDALARIEKRQQRLDAFMRAQLNIHNVALFRASTDGKFYEVNRQYQRMTGLGLEELKGEGWYNAVAPKCRERVGKMWDEAIESEREFNEDIFMVHSSGKTFKVHINVYKEMCAEGTIQGYLGVVHILEEEE